MAINLHRSLLHLSSNKSAPVVEDKGEKDGTCNRTACQRKHATQYNTSTGAYYCSSCAHEIDKWTGKEESIFIDESEDI